MKKYIVLACSIALGTSILMTEACKKKKTEASPTADFSISSATLNEGDTLIITNKSANAASYNWKLSGTSWVSTQANPMLIVDSAGTFSLNLDTRNGDGKTASHSMNITVQPDTVFRLSANSKKTWHVTSILYNGSEMLSASCQKDDELIVWKTPSTTTDTCQLTEGNDKCPPNTYYFDLPTTSQWRVNKSAFEFSLVILGSPVLLSFNIVKCTKWEFEGYDATNKVTFKMVKK